MNWDEKLVEEYSSLSDEELRLRFASAAASEGMEWIGGEAAGPLEWLEKYGHQLRKKICGSKDIKRYHSSKKVQERVQLYSMIGDAVLAYYTGVACLVIVETIVRKGVGEYCKSQWDVKHTCKASGQYTRDH